jgi:hypothetical protein
LKKEGFSRKDRKEEKEKHGNYGDDGNYVPATPAMKRATLQD